MSRPTRCGTASTKHLLLAMTFSVTQLGAHQVTILLPWIYFYCSESTRHPYTSLSPHHASISCRSCLASARSCSICAQAKNIIRNSTSEPTPTQDHVVTMYSSTSTSLPTRVAKLSSAAGRLTFPVQRLRLANMRLVLPESCRHAQHSHHAAPNTSPASTNTSKRSVKATTAHCGERSSISFVHTAPSAHVPAEWFTSVFPQKWEKIFSR